MTATALRDGFRDELAEMVHDAVGQHRRRGMKNERAIECVARLMNLTARRVRSYLYDEVQTVPAYEVTLIRAGRRKVAAERVASLRAELAAEQANLERLEKLCAAFNSAQNGRGTAS